MNRVMVLLAALAGIGGSVFLAGQQLSAQAPPPAAAAPPPQQPTRVAVFNVAKVMREFQCWLYFAGTMNVRKYDETMKLAKIRSEIAELQRKAQDPAVPKLESEGMLRKAVEKQRQFEDQQQQISKLLDEESQKYLKQLYGQIQQAVKATAVTNNYDLVLAFPDAVTEEERNTPAYFDIKMRPPAAMPFYVSSNVDITDVLVATLNKYFPAPGPIPTPPPPPVQPTAATTGPGGK